ncbi:MAG TPA: hypothetical protein VFF60_11140 [Candidatus Binatus sp.]|nr:hypothetical protein [Candidatus Binatus sp.]
MARTLIFTVLAIFCFALPFFVVSCQGYPVNTVSGIDLVIGRDVPSSLQGGVPQHLGPNMWAVAGLIFAVVAALVIVVWRNNPTSSFWATGLTTAGALSLLAVLVSVRDALTQHLLLVIRPAYGYYLAVILLIAAAVSSLWPSRTPGGTIR